jgi:hypothetical protein
MIKKLGLLVIQSYYGDEIEIQIHPYENEQLIHEDNDHVQMDIIFQVLCREDNYLIIGI